MLRMGAPALLGTVSALALGAAPVRAGTKVFKWPVDTIGERTSERVTAGKRAGKYVCCGVCEYLLVSLVPSGDAADTDSIVGTLRGEELGDLVSDVPRLCQMKRLAELMRASGLELLTNEDGSATVRPTANGSRVFWEEINRSDLAFQWKAFAVEHACTEVFRKGGGELVAGEFVRSFERLTAEAERRAAEDSPGALLERLHRAARRACRRASFCKASQRLLEEIKRTKVGARADQAEASMNVGQNVEL